MNTVTTITIKTDKKLRDKAKITARKLGIPLATVVNASLERFVAEQEITLSVPSIRPRVRPEKLALWKKIREEADRGIGVDGSFTLKELLKEMDRDRARA